MSPSSSLSPSPEESDGGGLGIQLWVPWWLGVLSHLLILGWGAWEVKQFMDGGIFEPDFEVIHQAWIFGFRTFPLILLGAGVLGCVLGSFHPTLFGRMAWWTSHGSGIFIALGIFALGHYVTHIEPSRMIVREENIESSKVSEPLRILHLSDIQSGGIGDYERRVFRQIEILQPDLIVHSGDWLQPIPPKTFESELPELLALIRRMNPPLGFFGVYGDTDGAWYDLSQESIQPLIMMESRPYLIEWSGGTLALRGLGLFQSHYAEMARQPVREWLESAPEDAFRLLIGHSPDYVLNVSDLDIDLCLAGHTHGGQIRFPFLGPLIIDSDVPLEWSRGFRKVGNTRLNVSAGLGSTHSAGLPSIRLFCPTEMTLILVNPSPGNQVPDEENSQ